MRLVITRPIWGKTITLTTTRMTASVATFLWDDAGFVLDHADEFCYGYSDDLYQRGHGDCHQPAGPGWLATPHRPDVGSN